jgi:hypothetical protein
LSSKSKTDDHEDETDHEDEADGDDVEAEVKEPLRSEV